jgi:hypothetical protein
MSKRKLRPILIAFRCTQEEERIIETKCKELSKKLKHELTVSDFMRYLITNTDV